MVTKCTHADGYGVILIDDGNNIHCQQFFESVDCIKITRSLCTMLHKWNGTGGEKENNHTSDISPFVKSTCAMGCSSWPNRLSQSAMRRPCPMAANA